MTRNDAFFKILFAIQIALLPMVIFAYLFLPGWSVAVFIAGVLMAKIWIGLFNDKTFMSVLLISISNILTFGVLLILFMINLEINIALGVIALILIIFANIFRVTLLNRQIIDTIEAVDYCYNIFEYLALIALAIIMIFPMLTTISLFAIILTAVVSVGYKIYFVFKYTDFVGNIKNLFKRK